MAKKWQFQDYPEAPDYNRWEEAADAVLNHNVGLTTRYSKTALTDNKTDIATDALYPNGTGTADKPRYKVGEVVIDLTNKKLYLITEVATNGKAKIGTTIGTMA